MSEINDLNAKKNVENTKKVIFEKAEIEKREKQKRLNEEKSEVSIIDYEEEIVSLLSDTKKTLFEENYPVLELKNVTKKIGSKKIVDNLNFKIKGGEILGLVGPNGAGKTTTIRMIVGLMFVSEGRILIEGKNIKDNFEETISNVGAIVENPEMYNYLSGYKNLIHCARMHKNIKKERIEEVVRLVGLERVIMDKVKTYSLGMKQRLGLAQALLHKPKLLILDEPTNGLDPKGIKELRSYLNKLAKEEGLSILISSHLLSEIELLCDKIAVIEKGKVKTIKRIKEILREQEENPTVFIVDKVTNAKKCLEGAFSDLSYIVNEDKNEIIVTLKKELIPSVTFKLLKSKIKIYEVRRITKNLEDSFLELTKGEKND